MYNRIRNRCNLIVSINGVYESVYGNAPANDARFYANDEPTSSV
jgi:hypothetical protein